MKRSIAGDATKLICVKVLTTVLTMISTMLLSRFRTLEEYGTYSQIQLVITTVITLLMVGLPNSTNYFLGKADSEKEKKEFLSIYYTLCTISGLLSGVLILIGLPIIEKYFNNSSIGIFWYFMLLYPWTRIILSGIENILIIFNRIRKLIIFKVLYGFATLGIIAVCWFMNISFYNYMIFFLATEIGFSLWAYKLSGNPVHGLKICLNKNKIKEILNFSLPVGLASVVGTISIELDKLMIGYFYNTEELAIYTNASKEMPVTIVASAITAVLMPQMVKVLKRGENKKAVELWKDATSLSYICIAFLAIALFVFAPDVITILYSEKYLPGVSVFRIYSLVLLLRTTYFAMVLNAVGKTKFIFNTSIISLLINVVLNFICYVVFGFIGPAIATFVSIAIVAFIQLWYTSREINIPIKEVFPWKTLGNITGINIVMGIIVYIIKLLLPLDKRFGTIAETIFLGISWGIVYLVIEKKKITTLWNALNHTENSEVGNV